MRRVCLDTNQLVSSLLSTQGLQAQLIDAWRGRMFILLLGPGQADQVADVLRRPKIAKKYRITPADRRAFVDLLQAEGVLLPDEPGPGVCRDPDDDALLGCAAAGGVEYLVTGDDDLLTVGHYQGVTIVTARQFLTRLSTSPGLGR